MTVNAVETWKGIAAALDRSERWCRDMAGRSDDPLPVFKLGGINRLNISDLEAWLDRQRARSLPAAVHRTEASPATPGDGAELAQLRDEVAQLRAELRAQKAATANEATP